MIYLFTGQPGSGKTTWYNNQEWNKDCKYISTDKFIEDYALTQNKTYSEVFQEYMPTAINLMCEQVILAKNNNKNIIWDQTSTTILSRRKKFHMLPNYYHIAVVFKIPNYEVLKHRLNNRPGKIIPDEVVTDMISNWQEPSEQEGYKEIWYVT